MDVIIGGLKLSLSKDQVLQRLDAVVPEPVRTYAVRVGKRLYPCKQAIAVATGLPRAKFNAHQAYRVLERLGLEVVAGGPSGQTKERG